MNKYIIIFSFFFFLFSCTENTVEPGRPINDYIEFILTEPSDVTISIYDQLNMFVITLIDNDYYESGTYILYWDAVDENGEYVASGVYYANVITNEYEKTIEIILIK